MGLERAADDEIWTFALHNDFVIVSQDADFYERSVIHGHPPKVLWLTPGNTATRTVRDILLRHRSAIEAFGADQEMACLQIQ